MFMKRGGPPLQRQTSAERALARANQRLQSIGTVHHSEESSDNEDDINKYLSSLRKKTQGEVTESEAPKPGRKKLSLGGDISDISLTDSSEQHSGLAQGRSKFLKTRPTPQSSTQKPSTPAAKMGAAVGSSALQRSAVLAQASRLTGQYEKKKNQKEKTRKSSDSEFSAPSTDSDLRKKRGSSGAAEALYAKSARAKLGYLTDEESVSFGKDGGKFLKKKKEEKKEEKKEVSQKTKKQLRFAGIGDDEVEEDTPRRAALSPKSPSSHSSSSLRSDRLRRSPAITDSDDDMSTAELGEGLLSTSSGPLTPQSPKRRTSLRSPDTPRSAKKRVTIAETAITMSVEEEEDEDEDEVKEALLDVSELSFVPEQFAASPDESEEEEEEEEEAASDFVMSGRAETIMDAADFLDSESDEDDSTPRFGAVHSIDELSSASSVPEVESEIPSRRKQKSSTPQLPSASASSSSSSSTSSTVIRSEQRPATSQYSDSDFDSVSETERPTGVPESYATDFESATEQGDSYDPSRSSSSEETTFTESYTTRIRRRRRRRGDKDADKCVQTHEAGLEFHWDLRQTGAPLLGSAYGMAAVDLSPIAHFAVSPEALEAVTAYSPSVVALNNMLRQQLDLTRNFMATQRRLYDAMSRTIAPDYSYTTLEATKEYIRRNRPPTISMEEALREVEAEM